MSNLKFLKLFRVVGLVLFVCVGAYLIFKLVSQDFYLEDYSLLAALCIIVSALIASYSVMVSIDSIRERNQVMDVREREKMRGYVIMSALRVNAQLDKYVFQQLLDRNLTILRSYADIISSSTDLLENPDLLFCLNKAEKKLLFLLVQTSSDFKALIYSLNNSDDYKINSKAINKCHGDCTKYVENLVTAVKTHSGI